MNSLPNDPQRRLVKSRSTMSKMIESDIYEFFKIIKFVLTCCGLWPHKHRSWLNKFAGFISLSLAPFLVVFNVVECFRGFPNTTDEVHCLFMLAALVNIGAELLAYFSCWQKIHNVMESLEDPTFKYYEDRLYKYLKRNLQLAKIMNISIPFYYVVCLGILKVSPEFAEQIGAGTSYFSIYRLYKFVARFTYTLSGWNLAGINCLFITCVLIAMAHLEILHEKLTFISEQFEEIKSDNVWENSRKAQELLKEWIAQHTAVEKYIRSVEEVFSYNLLVYSINCAVMNCMILVNSIQLSFTSVEFFSSLAACMVITGKMSIYCILGQFLITMSDKICIRCYTINWYSCGAPLRKDLSFVVLRTQKPLQLTAGKLVVLSYETLATVLKATYTYFGVVSQMYANKQNP